MAARIDEDWRRRRRRGSTTLRALRDIFGLLLCFSGAFYFLWMLDGLING